MMPRHPSQCRGIALIELAIALIVIGLLLGGLLMPLATQRKLAQSRDTEATLTLALETLQGFAAVHGRLPCPASANSSGRESFCSNADPRQACGDPTLVLPASGRCEAPDDGFLPAASLDLAPVDAAGFLVDAWQQPIRYAVPTATDPATAGANTRYVFTAAAGMRLRTLPRLTDDLDLRVCSDPACAVPFTTHAVVVIWSSGKNAVHSSGGSGADERENPNPHSAQFPDPTPRRFIAHPPAAAGAAGGEFDDQLVWLSPHTLFHRLIAAGQLP